MFGFLSTLLLAATFSFTPPVNFPLSLAGNFGEPRPNHFHGGIDIRTGMVEGKPVFSVADGYVSRITIGYEGFGNAVYVTHPGGYTTVYCHLKKFIPQLRAFVKKWQYKNKKGLVDMRLRPTDFPVAQGQLIAVSGNTGASKAPHLHLEFHDTRTWSFLDPLEFLGQYLEDYTEPMIHAFKAFPVEGEGIFCGSSRKQSHAFTSQNLSYNFTAWGKVGFGIWANDYMDGSFGILGVRHTTLTVDGEVVFESDVDSIPYSYSRMVNSWGDYEAYCRTHVWFMKSFIEPGNKLPILHAYNDNRGIVTFDEERDYELVYTVTDALGNSRDYSFTVRGKKQEIPPKKISNVSNVLRYDRLNSYQRPGLDLLVAPGLLPEDVELTPKVTVQQDGLSDVWSFYRQSYPLFNWAKISLKLKKSVQDSTKLYIVSHYGADRYSGGRYKDGWVTGQLRELGARYEIAYDDVPPTISGFGFWGSDRLRIVASDGKSGLNSYYGYIDDEFVLFEPQEKSNALVCFLKDSPIKRTGRMRNFRFVAIDNRNNKNEFTTQFKY